MKYSEFIQLKNITDRLISLCDIHQTEKFLWQVNHFPDFDVISYDGPITKEYFFKNYWSIPVEMESVIDFHFGSNRIYHFDDFKRMSSATSIPYDNDGQQFFDRLFNAEIEDFNLEDYGFDHEDFDDFKLNTLKLNRIDNDNRKIIYEGTFLGDSHYIDPMDWAIYAWVTVKYTLNASLIPLYISLIGESYTLYQEDKHTLSFFILFSAFECFINTELSVKDPDEEKGGYLSDKVTELFEKRFNDLKNHEIYQALKPKFNHIKEKRNDIAHGKQKGGITSDFLEQSYNFVLIFIVSYTYNIRKFSEMKNLLKSKAKLS